MRLVRRWLAEEGPAPALALELACSRPSFRRTVERRCPCARVLSHKYVCCGSARPRPAAQRPRRWQRRRLDKRPFTTRRRGEPAPRASAEGDFRERSLARGRAVLAAPRPRGSHSCNRNLASSTGRYGPVPLAHQDLGITLGCDYRDRPSVARPRMEPRRTAGPALAASEMEPTQDVALSS